jgi:hypothetical protein
VYRNGPPTAVIAFLLALVGGTVLALGHLVGGAILVLLALYCAWATDRTRRDGDDHSGLY